MPYLIQLHTLKVIQSVVLPMKRGVECSTEPIMHCVYTQMAMEQPPASAATSGHTAFADTFSTNRYND